jgi:ubiquinone/menaquinone biosynthesis C-methylase UbiE
MSIYSRYLLPPLTNLACGSKPTRRQREKIVHRAYGDVLEVGFGGGLNLQHYDADKVRKVFGLEPSEGMRESARSRIEASAIDVELIDLPGEEIPLDDNSVDTVLTR